MKNLEVNFIFNIEATILRIPLQAMFGTRANLSPRTAFLRGTIYMCLGTMLHCRWICVFLRQRFLGDIKASSYENTERKTTECTVAINDDDREVRPRFERMNSRLCKPENLCSRGVAIGSHGWPVSVPFTIHKRENVINENVQRRSLT